MPTLNQIRNQVDSELGPLWQAILSRQETYFAAHGRYWQGIRTHNDLPAHDTNTTDEKPAVDSAPTDQVEKWSDFLPEILTNQKFALQCDVYDGPQGQGFVGTIWFKHNGNIYARSQNHGPETWRTQGWHVHEVPV